MVDLNTQELRRDILVVGASAGGIEPAFQLLEAIPEGLPLVIAVVIHRGAFGSRSLLAELMASRLQRPVVEPLQPAAVTPGIVYVGPRDKHLVFDGGLITSVRSAKQHFTRPAVDPLFISAAQVYGPRVIGVVLSGGGSDGVLGLIRIKAQGGLSLVQSPEDAEQPSMPVMALRGDHVDAAMPLAQLARVIPALAVGERVHLNSAPPSTSRYGTTIEAAVPGRRGH